MKTPELEKINKNVDKSQLCGEFLDWLQSEKELFLCEYEGESKFDEIDIYNPICTRTEELLAEFFGVDLAKAEKERQGLLDEIRANQ